MVMVWRPSIATEGDGYEVDTKQERRNRRSCDASPSNNRWLCGILGPALISPQNLAGEERCRASSQGSPHPCSGACAFRTNARVGHCSRGRRAPGVIVGSRGRCRPSIGHSDLTTLPVALGICRISALGRRGACSPLALRRGVIQLHGRESAGSGASCKQLKEISSRGSGCHRPRQGIKTLLVHDRRSPFVHARERVAGGTARTIAHFDAAAPLATTTRNQRSTPRSRMRLSDDREEAKPRGTLTSPLPGH
jgi:hypothetical protein